MTRVQIGFLKLLLKSYMINSRTCQYGIEDEVISVPSKFIITPEGKCKAKFPNVKIRVNEFAKCINGVIDNGRSKKLTGLELNKQLKKMGILSDDITADGKKRTILNDKSQKYGIETKRRTFNDKDFEMIVFNDIGKKFLLNNLKK